MGQLGRGHRLADPVVALGGSFVGAQPGDEDRQGAEQPGGFSCHPHQSAPRVEVRERDAGRDGGRLALQGHAEQGVEGQGEHQVGDTDAMVVPPRQRVDGNGGPEEQAADDQKMQVDDLVHRLVVEAVGVQAGEVQHEQRQPVQGPGHQRVRQHAGRATVQTLSRVVCTGRLLACRASVMGADRARKMGAIIPMKMCWMVWMVKLVSS